VKVLLMVILISLASCTSTPRNQSVAAISASEIGWPLLSPATLGESHQVTQILHGEYGDASFTLRSVVSVDAQQLTVIGLTSMGLRAFTLKYDGEHLDEQRAPQVPAALPARQLLNDLQLAFWPLPALQQAWQIDGGELSEPYPGTRRLRKMGLLLAEVHYAADPWDGRVWLRHFDHPYSLYIDSSPVELQGH
jgi:Protein of unknown function (DUF3261)